MALAHARQTGWLLIASTLFAPALLAGGCSADAVPPAPAIADGGHDTCVPPSPLDPPPPGESITAACERLVDARVLWESRFIGDHETPDRRAQVDSCVGLATLAGSRVTPADIERCVVLLRPSCHRIWNWYPPCLGYGWNLLSGDLKGTRAAGEACSAHLQCASGYCASGAGGCGRCMNPRDRGPCDPRVDECRGGTCEAGECQPYGKKVGEPCSGKSPECQPALYCDARNLCSPRLPEGAPCQNPIACAGRLYCRAGACAALGKVGAPCPDPNLDFCDGVCDQGVCAVYREQLDVGADCRLGRCLEELSCDGNVCAAQRSYARGDRCGEWCGAALTCEPDSFSAPTMSTCIDLPRAGDSCSRFGICQRDSYCKGFSPATNQRGTCVRKGLEAEACPCREGLLCASGTCVAYGAAHDCR